jgi:hypothetical protein
MLMKARSLWRSVIPAAVAALCAGPAAALDPFDLTVTVGSTAATQESLSVSFTTADEMIEGLDPNRLRAQYENVDPVTDPTEAVVNFRGLEGVIIRFPDQAVSGVDQGTRLQFIVPVLGITEEIVGEASRDDALRELLNRLKNKKGLLTVLLSGLARYSPIDPLAGNPDSLFSRRMRSDMDHGFTHKVSQIWGCSTSAFNFTNDAPIQVASNGGVSDIFAEAQARAADLQAQNEIGIAALLSSTTADTPAGSYKSMGLVVPLSYTAKLDFNPGHKVRVDLPLSYTDTEGAKAYSIGLGLAYTFPVTDVWSLTPSAGVGAAGSADLISGGGVQSYSLTSAYTWRLGSFALSMGNSLGKYDSMDLKFGDVEAAADIDNTVFTNGFLLTGPNSLIAKNMVVEYSFVDTRLTGQEVYIDAMDEIGVAIGHISTEMGVIDSYQKIGIGYLVGTGQGDISSLRLNLSARF